MRILALVQGPYGERIAGNIKARAPSDWSVESVQLAKALPLLIDDPEDFLPPAIPKAELLLALGESPGAAQLAQDVAELSKAQSVIAPVDNSAWLPKGLANQLRRELAAKGIASVFPRPFCSLTETSHDYGRSTQTYEDALIALFARHFGSPRFGIEVDPETRVIRGVEVKRSSACGSAYYVAERLVGLGVDEARTKAGLILHHYPCLCSMNKEWIDDRLYDTLMHVSGYIVNEHVSELLKPYITPPRYFTPGKYSS